MTSAAAPPWRPELEVDEHGARALVATVAPELARASFTQLGAGWDNTAWLVDEAWVFRFPRRRVAVACMEAELRALPHIAAQLPVAVTAPRFIGEMQGPASAERGERWPFAGYRYCEGEVLALSDGAEADEGREEEALMGHGPGAALGLARQLGEVLRRLHGIAPEGLGLLHDPLARLDVRRRRPATLGALRVVRAVTGARGAWIDELPGALDRAEARDLDAAAAVVVHGDLDARHLLIREGALSAIIDWGDVCLGAPAIDLSIGYSAFAGDARAAFFDAYGPVDATTEALARGRAIMTQARVFEWAHDIGDLALRGYAERALARCAR